MVEGLLFTVISMLVQSYGLNYSYNISFLSLQRTTFRKTAIDQINTGHYDRALLTMMSKSRAAAAQIRTAFKRQVCITHFSKPICRHRRSY